MSNDDLSRRKVLLGGLGVAAAAVLAGCAGDSDDGGDATTGAAQQAPSTTTGSPGTTAATPTTAAGSATTLAPTPECRDADDVTPAQTEGPYFKASSPERTDLRSGSAGTRLVLTGTVVTTDCRPVARALVDF
jgi:protocatechuate 3,4-dioxygenase beta subunit